MTKLGRREVQTTSGGMVEPVGRGQPGRSARIVGDGEIEEKADVRDW